MFPGDHSPLTHIPSRGSFVECMSEAAGFVFAAAKAGGPWAEVWGRRIHHPPLVHRAPDVAGKLRQALRARPAFCPSVAQPPTLGKVRPQAVD